MDSTTQHRRTSRPTIGALVAAVLSTAALGITGAAGPPAAASTGVNGRIAFYSDRDGNGEIYAMNANGTGQIRLTNNVPRIPSPHGRPTAPRSRSRASATAAMARSTR